MIPYGRQDISDADVAAVVEVLRSDWLTQGPVVPRFEEAVARYCGASQAVAVSNATSALHLACLALGVGKGDWVWTSPITFVASANCARYCGANVDFVDIDKDTWNLCPVRLADKLAIAEREGNLPKVVIPVHLAGQSCDMAEIRKLSRRYGFSVIEDASHAIGGRYQGMPVGILQYSDIAVFSFHPVKILTCGEGGVIVTQSPELANTVRRLRTHGITKDPREFVGDRYSPWHYEQIDLGYNYRLTDIQAALGLSQMSRLVEFIERRSLLAQRYTAELGDLPLQLPRVLPSIYSAWHLYVVRLIGASPRERRQRLFEDLHRAGVGTNLHYSPVHLQPYYKKLGFREGLFPEAERYGLDAITIPLYASMTDQQHRQVIHAVRNAFRGLG